MLIAADREARPVSGLLAALEREHGETEIGLYRAQTAGQAQPRRDDLDTVFAAIPGEPFTRERARIAAKIDAEARQARCVIYSRTCSSA